MERRNDKYIDELEVDMDSLNYPAECAWKHTFTEGLYTRKMYMGAGWYTSKIHLTEHQFAVLAGEVHVSIDANEVQVFRAGDNGVTQAGTRRVLFVPDFCIWMTVHATDIVPASHSVEDIIAAADMVEDAIIEKRENHLINKNQKELV